KDRHGAVIGFISQLMSVGDDGWSSIYDKIAKVEKSITQITSHGYQKSSLSDEIISADPKMEKCIEQAYCYAKSDEPVLIYGPTGVGKELFAKAIQRHSNRAQRPFICVNCASLSKEFISSELFGYAPGAFTGAHRQGKAGLMEKADGGTLFLDEIGELPLDAQGALLRVLETHQIQRLNALESRKVDFRLITATNRNLRDMCNEHLYREDLFFRLSVLPLNIPPLCERRRDIPLLIEHFLNKMRGVGAWTVQQEALDILQHYSWPGNVRELRNALAYAVVNAGDAVISSSHLPPNILDSDSLACPTAPAAAKAGTIERRPMQERERLVMAVQKCGGNISCVARLLGMSRTTVYAKLRQYDIPRCRM
ncbi:MAG TPA: sigma-54-dependent Fis family transcriptional regulator, partial [Candidatus Avidesulfovibrio excrementigallinarum]|nr:sigma-54-dependent Fis family transcriptional regulator [Candidatus Avidesulfovibrio excrementigallinarum]